jgi:hypothetical protein
MIEMSIWGKTYDTCFSIEVSIQSEPSESGKVEYVAEFISRNIKEPQVIVQSNIKELIDIVYAKMHSKELLIADKIKEQFFNDRGTIISMALQKIKALEEELKTISECEEMDKQIFEDIGR